MCPNLHVSIKQLRAGRYLWWMNRSRDPQWPIGQTSVPLFDSIEASFYFHRFLNGDGWLLVCANMRQPLIANHKTQCSGRTLPGRFVFLTRLWYQRLKPIGRDGRSFTCISSGQLQACSSTWSCSSEVCADGSNRKGRDPAVSRQSAITSESRQYITHRYDPPGVQTHFSL